MSANISKNLDLNLMGGALNGGVSDLPANQVAHCKTWQDALRLCVGNSRVSRSQADWADLLGLSTGHWNTILNGDRAERTRHISLDLVADIQLLAGNRAIEQYLELRRMGMLNSQRTLEQERQALLQRLAELEGAV